LLTYNYGGGKKASGFGFGRGLRGGGKKRRLHSQKTNFGHEEEAKEGRDLDFGLRGETRTETEAALEEGEIGR